MNAIKNDSPFNINEAGNMYKLFFDKVMRKFDYFGDMTSLHGIRNVFSVSYIHYLKRIFWLGILLSCSLGAALILQSALKLFSTSGASYSVETDYLDWDTNFPAVTICGQYDKVRVKEYLNQHKKSTYLMPFYKDVAFWNVKYCTVCAVCEINVTCEEDFGHGIKEIRQKCLDLLTDCWWGGKHFKCCDRFHAIATEYGECYVFNSALLGNTSTLIVNRKIGLPDLLFTATESVDVSGNKKIDVIIHASEDIVSVIMENILGRFSLLPLVTEFEAILKVEQTTNDVSVLSLPKTMRNCLFKMERPSYPSWPFEEYTYSGCLLYCRMLAQSSVCNCSHHFLSSVVGTPACDVKGLLCLYQNKDVILNFHCECPTACDYTQYKAVHIFSKRISGKLPLELINRGSRGRVRLAHLPTLRIRRLAIKDTLGLVVDIGGVGGVFFGASLLSVIELFYLFFIRRN